MNNEGGSNLKRQFSMPKRAQNSISLTNSSCSWIASSPLCDSWITNEEVTSDSSFHAQRLIPCSWRIWVLFKILLSQSRHFFSSDDSHWTSKLIPKSIAPELVACRASTLMVKCHWTCLRIRLASVFLTTSPSCQNQLTSSIYLTIILFSTWTPRHGREYTCR